MKLIGIEGVPLDKTKKVLVMLQKLVEVGDDCGEGLKVYNNQGKLVDDCTYNTDWSDGWREVTYFVTMKNKDLYYNWICYTDKNDGYRSYSGLYQFKHKDIKLCHNLESFNLNCSYTENFRTEKKKNQGYCEKEIIYTLLKVKCKHKPIFHCYTDYSDSYYPLSRIDYKVTDLGLKYDDVAR